ncbi:MAG: adenosylhomocysteinase [Firmicutes bacterium]|nr:adenosylhomocysteinase [Bacillota bacterium]
MEKTVSMVRNLELAPLGKLKIDWVKNHMPVLNEIRREFSQNRPFEGIKIAICLHLEAKTAYLAQVLHEAGAQVAISGSNPLSTQDDVAAALADSGVQVFAWHGCTAEEYNRFLAQTASIGPDLVIDDGGDLVHLLHTDLREHLPGIKGGCEETTTGLHRLRAMAARGQLEFPMIAVNDAYCKYLFDNRYGTGQSTWDGIMRTTNLVVAGKTVVVAGYGWCGRGVAFRAKGLGAQVIVTEINPIRALEAMMDGFQVMPMAEAARLGQIFITLTGCKDVIRGEHLAQMRDGVILANAGHFDVEINKHDLRAISVSTRVVRENIEEFQLEDGRKLYLLGEGRLVNLACADGHPAEIMDLSFGIQALSLEYLLRSEHELPRQVIEVPDAVDKRVAWLRLNAGGIQIDTLSQEQERYLAGWD